MLQIEKSRLATDTQAFASEVSSSQKELWSAFVAFLRRQYPIILLVLILALAIGVVYLIAAPIKYTGEAEVILDTHKIQLSEQQQTILSDVATVDPVTVDTQTEILKSAGLARSVIRDLHLIGDPEFTGEKGGPAHTVIKAIFSIFGSARQHTELELDEAALKIFQSNLTIKRRPGTYIIEIYYVSLDARRAAAIANAVADAYIADLFETKYQATRRAAVWLQSRADELREQVAAAERAAVDYRTKNNIVDTGGGDKKLMNQQQLTELTSALIQARAQTAEAKARMDRANDIIRVEGAGATKVESETVTDSLHNEMITQLRQKYLDLAAHESEWSKLYGPQHLAVIRVRNRMEEISRSIDDELHRIAESYKSEYEIARSREEAAKKGLSEIVSQSNTTSEAQITLHNLESNAQTYRNLYDNFLQRYTESVQQQSLPITEARIISPAVAPMKNSHPNVPLVLSISLAGGLMFAFGVSIFRDLSDHVFRTASQVEATLHAACIGILPVLKRPAETWATNVQKVAGTRSIVRGPSPSWHIVDSPFSRFSEAIRSVKMAADLLAINRSNKVLGITSSLPNEGKSTIATALALSIAFGQSRVILVDCDLRNPSLSRNLTPNANVGLFDVLSGRMSAEEVIWTDPITNLAFLPVVMKSRVPNTGDILGAARMRQLFDSLQEHYDYVVVDLSPLAPLTDVRATPHFVDSYIYVIEWGRTKTEVVETALESARGVYERLLGVVLNKTDINLLRRFENHRGQYYSDRYHSRYGYTE